MNRYGIFLYDRKFFEFPEGSTVYLHEGVKGIDACVSLIKKNVTLYLPASLTHICNHNLYNESEKIFVIKGSYAEEWIKNTECRFDYEVIDEIVYPEE